MTRMQLLCSTLVALHLLLIVIPVASRSIETGIVHVSVTDSVPVSSVDSQLYKVFRTLSYRITSNSLQPTVEKFFLIYSDFARGYLSHNRSSDELTIDRRGQLHHASKPLIPRM